MQYMFQSAPAFAQSLESWPETTSTLATNWYGPTHEMFNGATAFRSKFSCPSGNYGPPVKCVANNMDALILSDSSFTKEWHYVYWKLRLMAIVIITGPLLPVLASYQIGTFRE